MEWDSGVETKWLRLGQEKVVDAEEEDSYLFVGFVGIDYIVCTEQDGADVAQPFRPN